MGRYAHIEPAPSAMAPVDVSQPAPPGPLNLVLRALIAIGLVAGWVQLSQTPMHRSVEDLLWALESGEVTQITMERPPPGSQDHFPVEWEGTGRPGYSTYPYNTEGMPVSDSIADGPDAPDGFAEADHRTRILESASRAGVPVIERDIDMPSGGIPLHVQYAGVASLAALILLIAGQQPRLATKWAWFWLAWAVPVAWLVFVILEPTLWGRSRPEPPPSRRLTGGWAFLLALVLAGLLTSNPWYRDMFPP